MAMSMQLVDASGCRAGEELMAMRGETLAVDGVVQAGEAQVLPYPGATTPCAAGPAIRCWPGARVLKGAIRVLATRVGDERSLLRLTALRQRGRPRSGIARARVAVASRFGGVVALVLAGASLLAECTGPPRRSGPPSAVLLAAPLLSLRRATASPLRAAAAMAGARGIVYQSASALDTVGRVTRRRARHRTAC